MNNVYVSAFNDRQTMQAPDFEIFHYRDSSPCNISLHHHDFFEIYFLLSNTMNYIVEGRRYTLTPGNLLLITPHDLHHPIPQEGETFERIVLWFSPSFLLALANVVPNPIFHFALNAQRLLTPDPTQRAMLEHIFSQLLYETSHNEPEHTQMSYSLLAQMFIMMKRIMSSHPSAAPLLKQDTSPAQIDYPGMHVSLAEVFEYINTHLTENLTLRGLSEMFFFDMNTLSRKFKKHVGVTVCDYIRKKRLAVARLLIAQKESVITACTKSGFQDYSTFFRAFKKEYGISPRDFSLACQEDELDRLHRTFDV